ncbi:MAG: bile acid:sodium symporter [Desulfobacula sp.]|nr:bile acid:sodium symporter [Desulfobacula sp.]
MQKIKEFWFLIGLVLVSIAIIVDQSNALAKFGIVLKDNYASEIIIFIIFIVSGLLIEKDQIKAGIKDIKSTLLSLMVILIIAPAAALLSIFLPLETGVVIGLFLVAVMPTTLSSGVVMTGAAGGNMAHALFITIISNFIGIVSIPFILSWLLLFLNQNRGLSIDQGAIIIKLVALVLVPLIIGIYTKPFMYKIFHPEKKKLQILNQCMVIGMVFISLAGAKQVLMGKGFSLFYIIILVMIFHLILLGSASVLIKVFSVKKGSCESILFMGSQKTLPLSIMIQVSYFSEYGIALLVCVVHHIVHLLIDGYLSARMGKN